MFISHGGIANQRRGAQSLHAPPYTTGALLMAKTPDQTRASHLCVEPCVCDRTLTPPRLPSCCSRGFEGTDGGLGARWGSFNRTRRRARPRACTDTHSKETPIYTGPDQRSPRRRTRTRTPGAGRSSSTVRPTHTRIQQPHIGQEQPNDEIGALSIKAKLIWSKPKHL
jgi:hypothetical protein